MGEAVLDLLYMLVFAQEPHLKVQCAGGQCMNGQDTLRGKFTWSGPGRSCWSAVEIEAPERTK